MKERDKTRIHGVIEYSIHGKFSRPHFLSIQNLLPSVSVVDFAGVRAGLRHRRFRHGLRQASVQFGHLHLRPHRNHSLRNTHHLGAHRLDSMRGRGRRPLSTYRRRLDGTFLFYFLE